MRRIHVGWSVRLQPTAGGLPEGRVEVSAAAGWNAIDLTELPVWQSVLAIVFVGSGGWHAIGFSAGTTAASQSVYTVCKCN